MSEQLTKQEHIVATVKRTLTSLTGIRYKKLKTVKWNEYVVYD